MPKFTLETWIAAPAEICFDLVRDVRVKTPTHDKAIAGVTDGMFGPGQIVTFVGTHFGFRQRLTVKVVEFERPRVFVDEMIEGTFESFRHIHEFAGERGGTLLRDTLTWRSHLGILGRVADKLLIERHLRCLVSARNAQLKLIAESDSREI